MRRQKDQTIVMTEGPVFSELMQFFIPITLGSLMMQLYHMVDAVVLGKLVGKSALAAVGGSSVVLINLVLGFFSGLSSGMAVVVSQHYGAGEDKEVEKAVPYRHAVFGISGRGHLGGGHPAGPAGAAGAGYAG